MPIPRNRSFALIDQVLSVALVGASALFGLTLLPTVVVGFFTSYPRSTFEFLIYALLALGGLASWTQGKKLRSLVSERLVGLFFASVLVGLVGFGTILSGGTLPTWESIR